MLRFFIKWLKLLKVPDEKITVRLHFYKDMNYKEEVKYWRKELQLKPSDFRKHYIKNSNITGLTYKNGFSHGTCNIIVFDKNIGYYVHMGIKYLQQIKMRV